LRISTRLVDAETGYTLWSEVYDRKAEALLDVQQEIAQTVVARLEVELRGNEATQLVRSWTENPQAYDHFLRGIQYQLRAPTPDNVASGTRHFEQAIEIDSTFGRAYARLAVQQIVIGNFLLAPAEEAYSEAERLARRAIELDGELFEAYWALGWTEYAYRHDWQKARKHFQRTIALAPGEWAGYHSLGLVEGTLGRTEQALEAARIAFDLDPLAYYPSWGLYAAHYRRRDYGAAARQIASLAELQPDDPYSRLELGILLIRMGREAEADRYLADAQRLDGGRSPPWMQAAMALAPAILGDTAEALAIVEPIARAMDSDDTNPAAGTLSMVYSEIGRRDEAMRWLTEARASYDMIVTFLNDPAYDSLRDDPRFAALIRELGLPEDVYLRTND
jgi:tetratricopeptide (TPR) repeat protein